MTDYILTGLGDYIYGVLDKELPLTPEDIAAEIETNIELNPQEVLQILRMLKQMGLARKTGDGWVCN